MEFLPLCDVLFNVISLAEYFCHILFDFVFFYAVFDRQDKTFSLVILFILLSSLVVSQVSCRLCEPIARYITCSSDLSLPDRLSKMVLRLESNSGGQSCSRSSIIAGPREHAKDADHVPETL